MSDGATVLDTPSEIRQGAPDPDALWSFLEDAFDGWGTRAYFRWKYDRFPGYDAAAHNFYVADGDEIVAARRVFPKQLLDCHTGETTEIHVHGGTAVAPRRRGEGLFTDLVRETRAYSKKAGSPLVATFNRRGKISTKAHFERGWAHRVLPVHLRVLSPSVAVSEYAAALLRDRPVAERLADAVTPRIAVSDGYVGANDIGPDRDGRLGVSLADPAVRDAIEMASGACGPVESCKRALSWLPAGDVRPGRVRPAAVASFDMPSALPADVTVQETLDSETIEAVCSLFASAHDEYDLAFRRAPADVTHQLQYPSAVALTVGEGPQLSGYAAVGCLARGSATEARVLDVVADDRAVFQSLVTAIEWWAAERGADLIAMMTDEDPGRKWALTRTEYVMWDWFAGRRDEDRHQRMRDGDWRLGIYDVL